MPTKKIKGGRRHLELTNCTLQWPDKQNFSPGTQNAATIDINNLMTGESILRGVKPEVEITINGVNYQVGGLKGQQNYAFLRQEDIEQLEADQAALQFTGYEVSEPPALFAWNPVLHRNSKEGGFLSRRRFRQEL